MGGHQGRCLIGFGPPEGTFEQEIARINDQQRLCRLIAQGGY
jgi:hypothetical protein